MADQSEVSELNGLDSSDDAVSDAVEVRPHDMKKFLALFLLKAKEVHNLSQRALDGLITDMTILLQQYTVYFKADIERYLCNLELNITECTEIQNIFSNLEQIDPFQGLHSKFMQEKVFREQFGLVVSCDI